MAFDAIVTKDAFESLTDPVGTLVDECKIHLNEEGLEIRAVDPANVGMVDSELDKRAFESYEADGGLLGVDLARLTDVVGFADSDDLVSLSLDEETRKLHVQIEGMEYTLALIDPDSIRKEPDLPDLDLPAEVVLEGRDLDRGIKAADLVSDHIRMGVDEAEETFVIDAEGDLDDVVLELDKHDLIDLDAGAADSLFSLDYLKDMNRAIDADAEVTVRVGEEFPTKISFETAEGHGHALFMLAPRIQN